MDNKNQEELESDVSMKTKYLIINVTCINYTYTFLRRRTNLNRKNDHVSSTAENALLPVEEQRWNWRANNNDRRKFVHE